MLKKRLGHLSVRFGRTVKQKENTELTLKNIKLTIELVPETCWVSNVRTCVSERDWDRIRKASYKVAGNKCEICKGQGPTHPVECHEVWAYDDKTRIQKLERMISLCPSCHRVKHFGLSQLRGLGQITLSHLAKINEWDLTKAHLYTVWAMEVWEERSGKTWRLDLSLLDRMGITYRLDRKNE